MIRLCLDVACRELRRCLGLLGKQEEARKLSELCLFMKRHSNEIDYDSMTTSSHAPAGNCNVQ